MPAPPPGWQMYVARCCFRALEAQANAELDLPFEEIGRESERLAGRKRGAALRVERRTVGRSHHVVDAGIVGSVGDIEAFGKELQRRLLAEPELTAQP